MAADPALHAPDAAREPPSAADARRVRAALDRALATDATLADFDAVRADVAAMLPPPPVDRARDAVDAWERDGASPDLLDALEAERAERWPLADVAADVADLDAERTAWAVDGWLPRGRVAMLTGKGGSGKSRLALQLAAALAGGMADWLPGSGALIDADVTGRAAVLATYEDPPALIAHRLDELAAAMRAPDVNLPRWPTRDDLRGRLYVADMAGKGPIWGPRPGQSADARGALLPAGDSLRRYCERVGARLLVIDPLAGAFGASENARAAVREFLADLDAWTRAADCTVLTVAHPSRSSDSDYPASGSTDWLNGVRAVWELARRDDADAPADVYRLTLTKSNYSAAADVDVASPYKGARWRWHAVDAPQPDPTAGANLRRSGRAPVKGM